MASNQTSIADGLYLWAEVDRLKAQVQELQAGASASRLEQTRIANYVLSFTTHAQLDAAMSTRVSQAASEGALEKLRAEIQSELAQKADVGAIGALHASKLDISVYEAGARDIKKFRAMLEQSLRDLFTDFASRIERQVKLKLSIDDFNRIFDPEANGQKAAIENAAARIAHMHAHIEELQRYVDGDHDRQRKVSELDAGILELTEQQAKSETALSRLQDVLKATCSDVSSLTSKTAETDETVSAWVSNAQATKHDQMLVNAALHEKQQALTGSVYRLSHQGEQQEKAVADLKTFTESTLVHDFDGKLARTKAELTRGVDALAAAHRTSARQVASELLRVDEKLLVGRDQTAQLDLLTRRLGAKLQQLQDDLAYVKEPLVTLATNLTEENGTILTEIHRSRHESREIMLDYRDLLEKEQHQQALVASHVPSRPTTAASMVRNSGSAAYFSRKTTQNKLLGMQSVEGRSINNRPHTSSARLRPANPASSSPEQGFLPIDSNTADGRLQTPRRAQTARAATKKSALRAVPGPPRTPISTDNASLSASESDSRSLFSAASTNQGDLFFFPVVSTDRS